MNRTEVVVHCRYICRDLVIKISKKLLQAVRGELYFLNRRASYCLLWSSTCSLRSLAFFGRFFWEIISSAAT
ncbi:hypothetical protein HanRHA438_Chr16g0742631 [Helianthus annuus]|nr:hypothetical protein HanRHA438_Chr16g0742631 [Helianthus annuus]